MIKPYPTANSSESRRRLRTAMSLEATTLFDVGAASEASAAEKVLIISA
jgi:hypothetical protein